MHAPRGDEPVGQAGRQGRGWRKPGRKRRPGGGTEGAEQFLEETEDLGNVSEREGGGRERGDLRVRPVRIAVGEKDRVGPQVGGSVGAKDRRERLPERVPSGYGITLFSGYSTIPDAPAFLSTGISSRTVLSSTMTSRLNQPSSESEDIVGV